MSSVLLLNNTPDFLGWRNSVQEQNMGLVPTMGNLHQGHLFLLQEALKNHSQVILSIFVNPKQFGPGEDFHCYPRTLENDQILVEQLVNKMKDQQKKVVIFAPKKVEDIFPSDYSTQISLGPLTQILCGKSRPGHFDGVTTVVYRLFALTKPKKSYFGQKDLQQLFLIKKMVQDLMLPIEIQGLPIIRDQNDLALSSRNQYLSKEQRQEALILIKSLNHLKKLLLSQKIHKVYEVRNQYLQDTRFEYLEVVSTQTLLSPKEDEKELAILGALRLGQTRLIDNILVSLVK